MSTETERCRCHEHPDVAARMVADVEELCDCGAPECELFNRLMRKLEEEQR